LREQKPALRINISLGHLERRACRIDVGIIPKSALHNIVQRLGMEQRPPIRGEIAVEIEMLGFAGSGIAGPRRTPLSCGTSDL
jgi:hypothetical protein